MVFVQGELFVNGRNAVLAATDCENKFVAAMIRWPTAINLRPAANLQPSAKLQIVEAASKIELIKKEGKAVSVSAVVLGRLNVLAERKGNSRLEDRVENTFGPGGSFPAELVYEDVEKIVVEELPAASELPVVPICDVFKNLPAWKGRRIAVRALQSGTSEGAWLLGDCKDKFVTDGLKWPSSLSLGTPAYYAGEELNALFGVDSRADEEVASKTKELRRGRKNVDTTATFVGTLRVRDKYFAECTEDGSVQGFGYGHLSGAPAEFLVEAVRDVEVVPRKKFVNTIKDKCRRKNWENRCRDAKSLEDAAELGCAEKTRQILAQSGIDSKGPAPSRALEIALRSDHLEVVQLLLSAGAPVNPVTDFDYQTPLFQAGFGDHLQILQLLIKNGVNVDQKNSDGETFLSTFGFSDEDVALELLKAGANPNARDEHGATALMHASAYGFESVVQVLLQNGADVHLADYKGRTALMYAAEGVDRQYYVDAIPLLLGKGADINRRDNDGKTALDIATELEHKYAIELLTSKQ